MTDRASRRAAGASRSSDALSQRAGAVRRLRWVLLGGALAWAAIAARLVQVQAVEHADYAHLAQAQHERDVALHARRGELLDRQGRELAFDAASVSFYARPAQVRDRAGVVEHFARHTGRSPQELRSLLDGDSPFVYLVRQTDDEQLERLRAHRFEGVYEEEEVRRVYPYGRLAGQLLGFTDIDNRGSEGAELAFEQHLAGHAGMARSYVDSRSRVLPERSQPTEPVRHGADVRLSVDAAMQGILEEELARATEEFEAESALGVITDPRTGDILALASVPLFDPNDAGSAPTAHRRNRLVTDPFEPGSTLKPVTMAAVLESGRVRPDTSVFCELGAVALSTGDTLRDTKSHEWLTASEVMRYSSNIGMVKLAGTLERSEFYESLRSFGFGTRTGIGLPAESTGLLRRARDWSRRSLETIAIGQELSVTAVQMVQAFGAIANGGVLMAPRLLRQVRAADGRSLQKVEPQAVRRVVSASTARILQDMLVGVVEEGTGQRAAIDGVVVAGKTGTAQRALPEGGGYAEDEYVSSFIGFLPEGDTARYLCLVVVENPRVGKYGGTVAAPAFRRTMERVLALEGERAPVALDSAGAPAQHSARAATAGPSLPDLRGLTPARARVQAARRGLSLRLEGEGQVIVDQSPPAAHGAGGLLVCTLGSPRQGEAPSAMRGVPLRQAALMRKLGVPRPWVALAP